MDTRSFACHILSKCEKHEVWTWQRHLYDASFQSFNDQNQCTTMNHISRIRKIITTLARIRLPSHQHEQQFSYKKNKIFYYKFFFFFVVIFFFSVTRQFVTSIKYQQIHINSGWFEVLPRHQHFILHLPDLYKNVLKMEQQKWKIWMPSPSTLSISSLCIHNLQAV